MDAATIANKSITIAGHKIPVWVFGVAGIGAVGLFAITRGASSPQPMGVIPDGSSSATSDQVSNALASQNTNVEKMLGAFANQITDLNAQLAGTLEAQQKQRALDNAAMNELAAKFARDLSMQRDEFAGALANFRVPQPFALTAERAGIKDFDAPAPQPQQPVNVPAPQVPAPTSGSGFYSVVRGDTLSHIAKRFNTTVDALLSLNPAITNRNLIRVGQQITLPGVVSVGGGGGQGDR